MKYIEAPSECLYKLAVTKTPKAIKLIDNPSDEVHKAAIEANPFALKFISKQTEALCIQAVTQVPSSIEFVKRQTPAICIAALKSAGVHSHKIFPLLKCKNPAILLAAVTTNNENINLIEDLSPKLIYAALKHLPISHTSNEIYDQLYAYALGGKCKEF